MPPANGVRHRPLSGIIQDKFDQRLSCRPARAGFSENDILCKVAVTSACPKSRVPELPWNRNALIGESNCFAMFIQAVQSLDRTGSIRESIGLISESNCFDSGINWLDSGIYWFNFRIELLRFVHRTSSICRRNSCCTLSSRSLCYLRYRHASR